MKVSHKTTYEQHQKTSTHEAQFLMELYERIDPRGGRRGSSRAKDGELAKHTSTQQSRLVVSFRRMYRDSSRRYNLIVVLGLDTLASQQQDRCCVTFEFIKYYPRSPAKHEPFTPTTTTSPLLQYTKL